MTKRIDRPWLTDLALIVGLIFAVTLPFLDRAFHLDDNQFIHIARNVLQNPWRPFSGQIVSFYVAGSTEVELEKIRKGVFTFQTWVHPPLEPYFIALVAYLSGGLAERSQHLAYLGFTLLAGVSAYFLARRFTVAPLWATLLLVASPVFILSAHSVMSDMPMLAFYQTALLAYVYGMDRSSNRWLVLSGVCLALALLTRYAAVTIVPVLVTYAVLRRARLSQAALPFLIAALLVGAWEGQNYLQYHKSHILAATSVAIRLAPSGYESAALAFLSKGIGFLIHAGSMLVFPLHVLLIFFFGGWRRFGYGFPVGLALSILLLNPGGLFTGYSKGQLALMLFFFTTGLVAAYGVMETGLAALRARAAEAVYQNADRIFLSAWFMVVLMGSLLGFPFAAARYLFPAALPLIIIVMSKGQEVTRSQTRFWLLSVSGVVLMLALSLNMAYADYVHARVYKKFTDYFSDTYKNAPHVWFIGEFGLRLYMEDKGYYYLPFEADYPTEGDLLVKPRVAAMYDASQELYARARHVASVGYAVKTPVRLFDYQVKAGYYSHGWGFLPFYFSRQEIERFEVFRISDPDFFLRTLEDAKFEAPSENAPAVETWTIDGDTRTVLFEHPPARLTYQIIVPARGALAFGLALSPEVWDKEDKGDGVSFEVSIVSDGKPAVLFSKYIDPKNRAEDRKWHDATIDLSGYEGKSVRLTFATAPGPNDDARYDWAGWGGLRLLSGATTRESF